MKILQISPQIPFPLDEGGKIAIYGITNYLHKRGNKIDFVTYRKHSNYQISYDVLKNICNPHILDVQTDNTLLGALKNLFSPVPYNISKYIRNEMQKFLINYFRENEVDIVHVDNAHMGWTIDIIKEIKDIPVVLRQQNVEMMLMKRFAEKELNPLLKAFASLQFYKFRRYEPRLCGKFDNCIMITKEDEDEILGFNSQVKTSVITAGIDSYLLEIPCKETIPFSLFHIGSLKWRPNYDGLIWFLEEVYPEIINRFPQTKLFIYGKGSENLKLDPSIKNNIVIKGYVEDLFSEISDKKIAIVPLRVGGGMRVKIIEMLALGKLIISSSIGKEGISVDDNEHLFVADNKEEYISKISDVLNNKIDSDYIIKNGRDFIRENYTWEKIALQFENKYRELLNIPPSL